MRDKTFLIRMPKSVHTELYYAAHKAYTSMSDFCLQAIIAKIQQSYQTEPQGTVLTGDLEKDKAAMIEAEKAARG